MGLQSTVVNLNNDNDDQRKRFSSQVFLFKRIAGMWLLNFRLWIVLPLLLVVKTWFYYVLVDFSLFLPIFLWPDSAVCSSAQSSHCPLRLPGRQAFSSASSVFWPPLPFPASLHGFLSMFSGKNKARLDWSCLEKFHLFHYSLQA